MSESELKDRLESTTTKVVRLWELLHEAFQYPLPEGLAARIHEELYPEKEAAKSDT